MCQPSHTLQTSDGEPLSPNRPRACSDNPPKNGSSGSPGQHHRMDQRDLVTSEKNLQKTLASAFEHRSKFDPQSSGKHTKTRQGKGAHGRKPQNTGTHGASQGNPMTGAKMSTPYPGKYKTVMCRFYTQGRDCPYGSECNYAHGKN